MPSHDTLKNINIFSECSGRELKAISRLITQVRKRAGSDLTVEGQPGREFLIIVEGQATVRRKGKVIARLGPGDFFGELAVVAGVPRTATVTADTDMVLEALDRREFASLLDESPTLAKKILVGAVKRLHELEESLTG
ncbi:MAG: cyclic nucleotide-binding domain-containing protein [Acidimicrobiia bacterium]|nr:cyclic nucleotide-binding domain-containing protein [Acidimicrobiia bacterium]MDH5238398.1 cyclic nucleotide-binding domain-containing protein [Acidimicrobiia bacterium]